MKYMFFDDRHLARKDGFVCRVTSPGRASAILTADQPWERGGLIGDPCMTVMTDDGVVKLWYSVASPDERSGASRQLSEAEKANLDLDDIDPKFLADILCPQRYYLCYAYSTDGKNWIKPALGICEVDGNRENNIVFGGRLGCTVFIDPSAPASSRYKMIHGGSLKLPHWLNDKFIRMAYTGIYGAESADGIHWKSTDKPIMPHYTDTTNVCFYDDEQKKYIAFVRTDKNMVYDHGKTVMRDPDHRTYRIISRSASKDFFNFPSPTEILAPETAEIQDYLSHWQHKDGMDFYNSSAMKYPYADGVYFLFPSYFFHKSDEAVIHIATGRDSVNFTRHDEALIKPDDAPGFYARQQYLACGMIPGENDSLTVYAHAVDTGHDAQAKNGKRKHAIIAYEFQTDGFIGQYADCGTLTTSAVTVPPGAGKLKLRCRKSAGGKVAIEVFDQHKNLLALDFTEYPAVNSGSVFTADLPENITEVTLKISVDKTNIFSFEII